MKGKISLRKVLGGKAAEATAYVLLFSLYTIVNSFGLSLTITRICYSLFYVISFWYFYKVLFTNKSSQFIKILNTLFIVLIIYGIILLFQDLSGWRRGLDKMLFLKVHIFSILPIYAFYYFGKNEKIGQDWFIMVFFIFIFDAYIKYYSMRLHLLDTIYNAEEGFTNNSGYLWASLLPMIAFLKNRKTLQFLSAGLIMFFVLTCFKRGAIVVSIVALLYFFIVSMKKSSFIQKSLIVILSLVIVVFLLNYFDSLVANNDFFSTRFERTMEGDSSNRNVIFSYFLNYFFSAENGLNILWGNGAFATVKLFGTEAHNDWLEYAIDMGVIGLVLYSIYWIRILKYYFYYKKTTSNNPILLAMGMVIIINLLRSFFSMSLDDLSLFSSAMIGYTMAVVDNERLYNRNGIMFADK